MGQCSVTMCVQACIPSRVYIHSEEFWVRPERCFRESDSCNKVTTTAETQTQLKTQNPNPNSDCFCRFGRAPFPFSLHQSLDTLAILPQFGSHNPILRPTPNLVDCKPNRGQANPNITTLDAPHRCPFSKALVDREP